MLNVSELKKAFPIFQEYPEKFHYLDNAATTQKPAGILLSMQDFYVKANANINRGVYGLAERADSLYTEARRKCADWIGARAEEIVFTKNATEAVNLIAYGYGETVVGVGDNVVVSCLEHHANYLPWQELAGRRGAEFRVLGIDQESWELTGIEEKIDARTKIVAITQLSNVLGIQPDLKKIIARAHEVGAKVVLDAAQGAGHFGLDVRALDVDFALVTGHKLFGPTGIGFAYIRAELADGMKAFMTGGGMVKELPDVWLDSPEKFEAGTPNIAGAIGLGAAIDFIRNIDRDDQIGHEKTLIEKAKKGLMGISGVKLLGPVDRYTSIISFVVDGIHPHDIASVLASDGVCVRAGHHCAKPLMKELGLSATVRASVHVYNTEEDILALISGVEKAVKIFK